MRKAIVAFFALMLIAGAVAARVADGEKKNVTNKLCPVSSGPVVEKYRTEYTDKETGLSQYVYVCCEGCLNEFNKTPDTFVAKMSTEEREAIKANTTCPVSGEKVSKDKFVEYEGRKVYFCCDGCKAKYTKDHPGAK
jgi:YHS domain-containing protein